ncbi:MAG: response regulator [Sphingomonadales bacterium]|nr:response regulator [Sphingomonadales bacterium]
MHTPLPDSANVLIVEDEFLIALQLETILIAAGYRVVGIMSDRDGLAEVSEQPEVALVDINLRDGPTGCDIARELSRRFGTVIVYVTANPGQISEPAPTAVGVVHKPFSHVAIEAAVTRAVNTRLSGAPGDAATRASALPVIDGRFDDSGFGAVSGYGIEG